MMADKKVFFGGLFDVHPTAYNEIITQFKELVDDGPFVSYDKANKAFTFMVNPQNDNFVSLFASYLKTYIDEQAESGPDPYQSPKIRPFAGTILQNALLDDIELADGFRGLLAIDSDDSSCNGAQAHNGNGNGHIQTYWKPRQGKISIVTTELATLLAQITRCSFFPDHGANQVGISGAYFNQALRKLQNLEKLQTHLASQRSQESSKAVANVLMLAKIEDNVAIQLVPLLRDTRPYQRIIVTEQSRIRLEGKCVGELRYLDSYNRTDHSIPQNLLNPSGTAENLPSAIWAEFSSLPLGSRKNMEPRNPSRSPSKLSLAASHRTSTISAATTSGLRPPETRKIESWRENIEEAVDPNEIVVEPPRDETRVGRQRRVAESDSDSEEDAAPTQAVATADQQELVSLTDLAYQGASEDDEGVDSELEASHILVTGRQPKFGSNDLPDEEYMPTPAPQPARHFGRTRRVRITDSDHSSDETTLSENTKPTPKAAQTAPKTANQVSAAIASSSPRIPSPAGIPRSIPPPFNLNSYPARGAGGQGSMVGTGSRSQTQRHGIGAQASSRGGKLHAQKEFNGKSEGPSNPRQEPATSRRHRGQTQTKGIGRGQNPAANTVSGGQQGLRGQATHLVRSRGRGSNRGRGSLVGISHPHTIGSNLVDIAPVVTTDPVMPPPGLDILLVSAESPPPSTNLLDEPLQDLQGPFTAPAMPSFIDTPMRPPPATGPPSGTSSSGGRYYVNKSNPGPDVAAMHEEQRRLLLGQKEAAARQGQGRPSTSQLGEGTQLKTMPIADPSAGSPPASSSNERLQEEDEVSSRPYHQTMGQQAPNPGKRGNSQKPNKTKKEREARIAKAKADAHGDIPTLTKAETPSPRNASSSDEVDKDMSVRKRQALKKSGLMAETNPAAAEEELRSLQTTKLMDSLKPLFEAARAFSGDVVFEVQFGQVISAFSSKRGTYQFIDLQEWHRRFHPQLGILPEVASFTNVLTTNGADADRILDMKSPGPGSVPVWSRSEPIPREVTYEFQCLSNDNEEFWLVVDQLGEWSIRRSSTTVGSVNLHFPGKVWDACATIRGSMQHHFSEAVVAAAKAFVSSLFVPPGQKRISITYRLPGTNAMTVRNLVMKRKSLHICNMVGKHEFQLEITEVQTLYHQFHKNDKKLGQGFVKDYSQMVNDGRLHYEVSLIHQGIIKLLEKNADLELGELTDAWTEATLLARENVRNLVDLTCLIVSKIDGIGSKNIGTLFRKDMEHLVQEREFEANPAAALASRATTSKTNLDASSHIQGVRGGRADVVWRDGQPYAFGFGGALVPIRDGRLTNSDEVVPDDSASQMARPAVPAMPVKIVHPAHAANISTSVQPRAGSGFW